MNKFVAFFCIFINLATIGYVGWQMSILSKTTQELKEVSIKLPPEYEAKLEGDLESVAAEVKASADASLAAIDSSTKSALADMEQISADMKHVAAESVAAIAPSVQSTFSDVRSNLVEMCRSLESVAAGVKASADASLAAIDSSTKSALADMEQISADMKHAAAESVAAIAPSVQSTFSDVRSNLVEMCRSKVSGNEFEAERAYQMAVQTLESGDIALAKIYCLNAISHSPTKKLYFEKLLEMGGDAREDLEQVKGLLELGIYQVSADEVTDMQQLLEGVIQRLGALDAAAETEQKNEQSVSTDQAWAQIRTGELSRSAIVSAKGAKRYELLQQRLAVLNELTQLELAPDEADEIVNEEAWSRGALEYFTFSEAIDASLLRAEKLLEEESPKLPVVSALVQTANQSLAQAFLLEKRQLPENAEDRLLALAKQIENLETRFNKIKSQPAIEQIRQILSNLHGIAVALPYQPKITNIQEGLKQISLKIAEIYDADERARLEPEIKRVTNKLNALGQAQVKAYQEWVIGQCKTAFDEYDAEISVSTTDARRIVELNLLEIDSNLLSPDVTRLYQDIMGKLIGHMSGKVAAETEIKLARNPKKQLSDF